MSGARQPESLVDGIVWHDKDAGLDVWHVPGFTLHGAMRLALPPHSQFVM